MLAFASISPHPPIIVPTIGAPSDLRKVKKTIGGMEKLRKEFEKTEIETALIISPHSPLEISQMGLNESEGFSGNFFDFADFTTSLNFASDKEICQEIKNLCQREKIPLTCHIAKELDHGILVPLFFLTKNLKPEIVPLSYSFLSREVHFKFGKVLGKIAKNSKRRIGIIASGDLSHRLSPEAPAGYSPRGKEFDKKIVKLLKENDVEGILNMDEGLIEEAGECGYRSIIILLGALSTLQPTTYNLQLISYEGPFGVGYLVGNFLLS